METIDKPGDAKQLEQERLENNRNQSIRLCKIAKGNLTGKDSITSVKNGRVVLRHISNPAVMQAIDRSDSK